ncbi:MAG: hypothetical protein CYPHOPRED_004353 [Cyphobasidiales sp. Tagirdzhanova-0007]|nr:MAG: hypothetical protein CYPHOPRED_004353 [Cyphobasidiales sp. Tagirdzhanova-0007]
MMERPARYSHVVRKGISKQAVSISALPARQHRQPASSNFLIHEQARAPALFLPTIKSVSTDNAEEEDILLEIQAINAEGDRKRSWFVGEDTVVADGKLLLLTPFDPVFLLARILLVVGHNKCDANGSSTRRSLPYEDIFESAAELMCTSAAPNTPPTRTKRLRLNDDGDSADSVTTEAQDALLREDLVRLGSLPHTRKGMDRICEVQKITSDLFTYKLNNSLLLDILKEKITRLATREAFDLSPTLARLLAKEGVGDGEGISSEVELEARQKVSLELIAGYLPEEISELLKATYTFSHLATYLANTSSSSVLSVEYMPGLPTPPLSNGPSDTSVSSGSGQSTFGMRLKGSGSGSESALEGALDRNKKKKGRALESNGVKQLKKASTRGMSPLTSFFAKKGLTPTAALASLPNTSV